MRKIIDWIKNNKLSSLILLILVWLIFKSFYTTFLNRLIDTPSGLYKQGSGSGMDLSYENTGMYNRAVSSTDMNAVYYPEEQSIAPVPGVSSRKVQTDSQLSVLVKDVSKTVDDILIEVNKINGYVINRNIRRSDTYVEATIIARVPNTQMDSFLQNVKGLAIKVSSENIQGQDITDRYVDTQRRMSQYENMIEKLQTILDQSSDIDQMIKIQNQIFSQQSALESLKGQLAYMDGVTSTSLVTIYMSTDEYSLPYVEPFSWRPELVFKQAMRSLLRTLQSLGSLGIWIGVYSVLVVPALIIFIVLYKVIIKRAKKTL